MVIGNSALRWFARSLESLVSFRLHGERDFVTRTPLLPTTNETHLTLSPLENISPIVQLLDRCRNKDPKLEFLAKLLSFAKLIDETFLLRPRSTPLVEKLYRKTIGNYSSILVILLPCFNPHKYLLTDIPNKDVLLKDVLLKSVTKLKKLG
ncbi:hypothetical protein H6G17_15860 [Chroococcidiopsis sp. FACHB-1243]|nr:hypothetical protein [Chroococcidiopsis sp. [FACHB-1243]]